ncbi:MAG: hypothetical protein PHY34_03085 [Patescibacteria group bacterium]|nr:hypothetical protein [Patescibacteria group bacterium]MDD5716140.1 hypothetical protein [Patescibacteria group bacterium]
MDTHTLISTALSTSTSTTTTSSGLIDDRGYKLRQSFLKYPGEDPGVDYKDAIKFTGRDGFSYKLIKHILGMANAGGGYIVIGYPEDYNRKPQPAEDMPSEILSSYEVSQLAQTVERYTAGTDKIDLLVHKDQNIDNNITYPIIEVRGFKKRPFFCKSSAGNILEEGALYIRIEAARTIKIANPDDWEKIIDICIEKRQSEMLSRFTDLMKEMGLKITPLTAPKNVKIKTDQSKKDIPPAQKKQVKSSLTRNNISVSQSEQAQKIATDNGFKYEGLEVIHYIVTGTKNIYTHKGLLDIADKSVLRNTGWPMGLVTYHEDGKPRPDNDGLRCVIADKNAGFDYWHFNFNGGYYFFRAFEEDTRGSRERRQGEEERILYFDTRIWRIAEAVKHCIQIYKNMQLDPKATIGIQINHLGIQERQLAASDTTRAFTMFKRKSIARQARWDREMTLDLLTTSYADVVFNISKGLFTFFDMWEPSQGVLQSVLDEFESRS